MKWSFIQEAVNRLTRWPGYIILVISHFNCSCFLHIWSEIAGKKFSLLCINYLQAQLVFLVFYVCIVRVKRGEKSSLVFTHFKQILCVTNQVCRTAGATFLINGLFKFLMCKGGFLKIEALDFNLDTSSVLTGYFNEIYKPLCFAELRFPQPVWHRNCGKKWQRWERESPCGVLWVD